MHLFKLYRAYLCVAFHIFSSRTRTRTNFDSISTSVTTHVGGSNPPQNLNFCRTISSCANMRESGRIASLDTTTSKILALRHSNSLLRYTRSPLARKNGDRPLIPE